MPGAETAATRSVVQLKNQEERAVTAMSAAACEDALGVKRQAIRSGQAQALDSISRFPSAKTMDTIMTTETAARNDSMRRGALRASGGSDEGSMKGVVLTRLRSVRDYVDTLSFRFASFRDSIRSSFRRSGRLSTSADQYASAATLREKVFDDLEALNAVGHATLLRGYGLPRVDSTFTPFPPPSPPSQRARARQTLRSIFEMATMAPPSR